MSTSPASAACAAPLLLFDFVVFNQAWDATIVTEPHGNLIAGLEKLSRNLMSCGMKPRIVAILFFAVVTNRDEYTIEVRLFSDIKGGERW